MDRESALQIRNHSLKAIAELTQVLNKLQNRCSPEEYEKIKRGVGLAIGKIQTDLLDVVVATHPDLDDLGG
jgi:hypothetical protein